MQTKRDYAASLGLAKAGARGKFSNDAKAAIAKAEASGMKFSDSTGAAPTVKSGPSITKAEKPAEVKTEPGMTPYLTPSEYRYPEAEYRAVTFVDGKRKEVGMRECCNTCRVSLVGHMCENPTIHGNIAVRIERR